MAVPPPSPPDLVAPDPMIKAALRAALRVDRDAFFAKLSPPDIVHHAETVAERLMPALKKNRCVGGYAPLGSEFPVLAALERAASFGIATALPHVTRREIPMVFRSWTPGTMLDKGYYGLSQPERGAMVVPDLILAPLLGFDRGLRRIGQGAGFYDRWLAANPDVICIGIAWSVQERSEIPVDAWDMPLHAIITENEWIGTKA